MMYFYIKVLKMLMVNNIPYYYLKIEVNLNFNFKNGLKCNFQISLQAHQIVIQYQMLYIIYKKLNEFYFLKNHSNFSFKILKLS